MSYGYFYDTLDEKSYWYLVISDIPWKFLEFSRSAGMGTMSISNQYRLEIAILVHSSTKPLHLWYVIKVSVYRKHSDMFCELFRYL